MIIYGTRLFGKCDTIDGLGHVATKFGHINFVPLIPLSGFFVLEGSDDRGIEIPVRGKSVLAAWTRAGTLVGGAALLISGLISPGTNAFMVFLGVASIVLFVASYWLFANMSAERRVQLLADTGLLQMMLEQQEQEQADDADDVALDEPSVAQIPAEAAASEANARRPFGRSGEGFGGSAPSAPLDDNQPEPFAEYKTTPRRG